MSHSWTHPWCKSPSRDEAVRAVEDGRSGPLPTLEEAIAAVTDRRPPEPGGGGNVTGLRTERVTLEVTHSVPVAKWDWTNILETYRPGESVRVVEDGDSWRAACESARIASGTIADITAERDAAIRERDEAIRDLRSVTAERTKLEEQLESVACRAATAETALRQIVAQDYSRAAVNGASWRMHDIAEKALESAIAASGNVEKKPMKMPSREWFERMASVDDSEMSVGGLASRVAELESAAKLAPAASEWRILGKDEYPRIGDQYKHDDGRWSVIRDRNIHLFTRPRRHKFRRRVTAPAASVVPDVVSEMADILRSNATDDEKHSAIATLVEAVCPGYVLSPAASGAAGAEVVAYFVKWDDKDWGVQDQTFRTLERAQDYINDEKSEGDNPQIVPLYAAPQPARVWLTPDERLSIKYMMDNYNGDYFEGVGVCEALLARSSPPEVVEPECVFDEFSGCGAVYAWNTCAADFRKALAAAGVTVKEVGRE